MGVSVKPGSKAAMPKEMGKPMYACRQGVA